MLLISRHAGRPTDRPTDRPTLHSRVIKSISGGRRRGERAAGRKYNTDIAWCASFVDRRLRDSSTLCVGNLSELMLPLKCADGASVTPRIKREMATATRVACSASVVCRMSRARGARRDLCSLAALSSLPRKLERRLLRNQCSPDATGREGGRAKAGRRGGSWRASTGEGDRDLRGVQEGRTGRRRRQNAFETDERVKNLVLSSYRKIVRCRRREDEILLSEARCSTLQTTNPPDG